MFVQTFGTYGAVFDARANICETCFRLISDVDKEEGFAACYAMHYTVRHHSFSQSLLEPLAVGLTTLA